MKITCSYCGKTIQSADDEGPVSHGVCSDCLPGILATHDIPVQDYLESVPYPAILVDDEGNPIAANQKYRSNIGDDTNAAKRLMEGRTTEPDKSNPSGQRYKGTSTVKMMVQEILNEGKESASATATAGLPNHDRGRMNMLIGTHRIGKEVIVEIEDITSIQWYSALSTGRTDLDEQHFQMDQLIHQIGKANFEDGVKLLKELARKLRDHFAFEEDIVENGRLLAGSKHRAAHKALIKRIITELRDAKTNGSADLPTLSIEIAESLADHVAKYDVPNASEAQ